MDALLGAAAGIADDLVRSSDCVSLFLWWLWACCRVLRVSVCVVL